LACITGGIAEAYYKVMPKEWIEKSLNILDEKLTDIVNRFQNAYK